MLKRTRRLVACSITLALSAALAPAWAQDAYPSKPIHIVVPYPAGGTTDQLARALQQPCRSCWAKR